MESRLRRFHVDFARAAIPAGLLRIYVLSAASAPAAAIYSLASGATLYCYLSAFDPAMAKLSPGAVLLAHVINHALASGMKEVDFLRDPEPYKYLWGARPRPSYKLSTSCP